MSSDRFFSRHLRHLSTSGKSVNLGFGSRDISTVRRVQMTAPATDNRSTNFKLISELEQQKRARSSGT